MKISNNQLDTAKHLLLIILTIGFIWWCFEPHQSANTRTGVTHVERF